MFLPHFYSPYLCYILPRPSRSLIPATCSLDLRPFSNPLPALSPSPCRRGAGGVPGGAGRVEGPDRGGAGEQHRRAGGRHRAAGETSRQTWRAHRMQLIPPSFLSVSHPPPLIPRTAERVGADSGAWRRSCFRGTGVTRRRPEGPQGDLPRALSDFDSSIIEYYDVC